MFIRLATAGLVLAAASHAAEAAPRVREAISNIRIYSDIGGRGETFLRVQTADDSTIDTVQAELRIGTGPAVDVPMIESDIWKHGVASFERLPATQADLLFTAHDVDGTALATFVGSLSPDGTVRLVSERDGLSCDSRVPPPECSRPVADIAIQSVNVVENGFELFQISIDLAGSDAYLVTSGDVVFTEYIDPEFSDVPIRQVSYADVDVMTGGKRWDAVYDVGFIGGETNCDVRAFDRRGRQVARAKAKLYDWLDTGFNQTWNRPGLVVDEHPLTSIALSVVEHKELADILKNEYALTVVSDGWNAFDATPQEMQVELDGGPTLTVPVHSYQKSAVQSRILMRIRKRPDLLYQAWDDTINDYYRVRVRGDAVFGVSSLAVYSRVAITSPQIADGTWLATATPLARTVAELPTRATLTFLDPDGVEPSQTFELNFGTNITAVFATTVDFIGDPSGLDLSGKVTLLGEPKRNGRRPTLAKGKFFGNFTWEEDGDLSLAAFDKDPNRVSRGDILIGGEPIGFERTVSDEPNVPGATPPALMIASDHGGQTVRRPATVVTGRPML